MNRSSNPAQVTVEVVDTVLSRMKWSSYYFTKSFVEGAHLVPRCGHNRLVVPSLQARAGGNK